MEGINLEDLSLGEERRLMRAVQHVSLHWLPVSNLSLSRIRRTFEQGGYLDKPELLFKDLKSDIGLFTHCFKSLVQKEFTANRSFTTDAYNLITNASLEVLKEILCDAAIPITHSVEQGDEHQLAQLRATTIASSFVEVASPRAGQDSQHGFSHSILRELGINLIAWNYPTLFQKALRSLTPRTSMEEELQNSLGFSPTILAICVIKPDGVTDEAVTKVWSKFEHLCEVGAALARANDPDTYPSAENDWETAREFIEERLGPDGFKEIQQVVVRNTEAYRSQAPEIFTSQAVFDPKSHLESFRKRSKGRRNPYIKCCPLNVREKLKELYGSLPHNRVSRLSVEKIIRDIIPAAGFTGGAVYVLDPLTMNLVPRVKIGEVTLRKIDSIPWRTAFSVGPLLRDEIRTRPRLATDLVTAAFECNTPLVEEARMDNEEQMIGLYGVIGLERRIGVLYLETPNGLEQSSTLMVFKALREALADSLHVSSDIQESVTQVLWHRRRRLDEALKANLIGFQSEGGLN